MIEERGPPENSHRVMDVQTQAPLRREKYISAWPGNMATGYECVGDRSILIDVTNDITDVEKECTGSSKWVIFSMQLLRWGIEAFSSSLRVGVVKWCMMLGTPPTQLKGATSLSHWHHWITVHQTCEAYKDGDVKSLLRRLEFCLQRRSMKIAVENV